MKHLTKLLAAAGVATLALAGCGGGGGTATSQSGGAKDATSFKACAVSDAGGWDDKSFNESAYEGLKASQTSLGIQINTAESNSDADFNPNVESMVSDGCNLIIGVGFNLEKAVHTSADENKDVHYALIDSSFNDGNNNTVTLDNARPLLFNTAEAAYLAGYVAAGMTKTGKVATFGGIQIPSVTVFMDGFAAASRHTTRPRARTCSCSAGTRPRRTAPSRSPSTIRRSARSRPQQVHLPGRGHHHGPSAGPVGLALRRPPRRMETPGSSALTPTGTRPTPTTPRSC